MAYNTKNILRDAGNVAVPQVWDQAGDQYRVARGSEHGQHVLLYDAAGNPMGSSTNPAHVALRGKGAAEGDTALNALTPDDGDLGAASLLVAARAQRWNGSQFDLERGNMEITLLASALRTATTVGPIQVNHNARGVVLALHITARTVLTTPRIYVAIHRVGTTIFQTPTFDPAIGLHFAYLYPGVAPPAIGTTYRAQGLASLPLPRRWNAVVAFSADVTDLTYSLTADLIL